MLSQTSERNTRKIRQIRLHHRQLPVTIDDLANMLEIDLEVFGDRNGFRRRLKRALENAFKQGRG